MSRGLQYSDARNIFTNKMGSDIYNESIQYNGFTIRVEVAIKRSETFRYSPDESSYRVSLKVNGRRLSNVSYREVDNLVRGHFSLNTVTREKVANKIEKIKSGIDKLIEMDNRISNAKTSGLSEAKELLTEYLGSSDFEIEEERYNYTVTFNDMVFNVSILNGEIGTFSLKSRISKEQFKKILG